MPILRVNITGNTSTESGSSLTIPSTTAKNLLIAMVVSIQNISNPTVLSIKDSAEDVFSLAARATNNTLSGQDNNCSVEIWYATAKLPSNSFSVQMSDGTEFDSCFIEYSPSSGAVLSFDTGSSGNNGVTSSSILVGSPITASGVNNLLLAIASDSITSVVSNQPHGGSTYNLADNTDGNGFSDLLNKAAGVYTPAWLFEADTTGPCSCNVSFSENFNAYSFPDCRDFGIFPNEFSDIQGTQIYTTQALESRKSGPPVDSRTSGAPADSRNASIIPFNSRNNPPF